MAEGSYPEDMKKGEKTIILPGIWLIVGVN